MTAGPEHCVTCGDTAVTAAVVHVDGLTATVRAGDTTERVGIELVEPVVVGELLLCHAGIALAKVSDPS
jgi:hydrogenase maturation factor